MEAAADATPRVRFNTGARVRARLRGGGTVTGHVLVPLDLWDRASAEDDSATRLVVCEADRPPCDGPDAPGARSLPLAEIRQLDVRGRMTPLYGRLGIYGGMLAGLAVEGEDGGGLLMALGGVAGAALGVTVGSRVTGWVPVFPCIHVCASGAYPDR